MNPKQTNESGWDRHEREQVEMVFERSTPTERLRWVEQMLMALGKERIEAHRELQEIADLEDRQNRATAR